MWKAPQHRRKSVRNAATTTERIITKGKKTWRLPEWDNIRSFCHYIIPGTLMTTRFAHLQRRDKNTSGLDPYRRPSLSVQIGKIAARTDSVPDRQPSMSLLEPQRFCLEYHPYHWIVRCEIIRSESCMPITAEWDGDALSAQKRHTPARSDRRHTSPPHIPPNKMQ